MLIIGIYFCSFCFVCLPEAPQFSIYFLVNDYYQYLVNGFARKNLLGLLLKHVAKELI